MRFTNELLEDLQLARVSDGDLMFCLLRDKVKKKAEAQKLTLPCIDTCIPCKRSKP